jgi:hypothetical protein
MLMHRNGGGDSGLVQCLFSITPLPLSCAVYSSSPVGEPGERRLDSESEGDSIADAKTERKGSAGERGDGCDDERGEGSANRRGEPGSESKPCRRVIENNHSTDIGA